MIREKIETRRHGVITPTSSSWLDLNGVGGTKMGQMAMVVAHHLERDSNATGSDQSHRASSLSIPTSAA